jgi:acyl carrier protein
MLKYINFHSIYHRRGRMDENEVKEKVKKVFQDIFSSLADFRLDMTSNEIKEWDSLSHMNLVSGLEKEFGLSMEIDDISEMDSVAKVLEVVERKLGGK